MKKIIILLIGLVMAFSLVGRTSKTNNQAPSFDNTPSTIISSDTTPSNTLPTEGDEIMNKELTLQIDNQKVDVNWLDNNSVRELKKLTKDGVTIRMYIYGGFEQVGSIGASLPSADTNITTSPRDILLYQSNSLVMFYDSNTWDYTKLGHINLSKKRN